MATLLALLALALWLWRVRCQRHAAAVRRLLVRRCAL